ncbi:hypothetical protein SDC9_168918 [bioreactor metagenome]|uniref:Uncharacterized protein n=1 Tax=bioreactor metagenome TaxID=1076179 RepID=A0A645G3U9_9ZZZZ
MNPRLGGQYLQSDAGFRRVGRGCGAQGAGCPVHSPVVVVPLCKSKLLKEIVHQRPDWHGTAQIHGGAFHRVKLPRGNGVRVGRRIAGG